MKMNIKIVFCLLSLFAIISQGCSHNNTSNDKKSITVSLEPQKYFLDKIVGDKINVNCLLKSSSNPESYEPSINDLLALEKSLATAMKTMLGINPTIHLVAPKSIARSEGKAVRVIDKRKLF